MNTIPTRIGVIRISLKRMRNPYARRELVHPYMCSKPRYATRASDNIGRRPGHFVAMKLV